MNYPLQKFHEEESARTEAANKAALQRHVEREERLRPAFETARFAGFSSNMPTNSPLIFETVLADFEGKDDQKFSLFIPQKDVDVLTKDKDYIVGFTPMRMEEHKSPSAMQFFISSMMRESPVMGEFVNAAPIPSGLVKVQPSGGTSPSPRG